MTDTGDVGAVLPGGTTGSDVVDRGSIVDTEFDDPEEPAGVETVVPSSIGAVSIGGSASVSGVEDEWIPSVALSTVVESEDARSVETESGRVAHAEASATMTRHAPRSAVRVLFMSESDDRPAGSSLTGTVPTWAQRSTESASGPRSGPKRTPSTCTTGAAASSQRSPTETRSSSPEHRHRAGTSRLGDP
jgi:hypothetical protein